MGWDPPKLCQNAKNPSLEKSTTSNGRYAIISAKGLVTIRMKISYFCVLQNLGHKHSPRRPHFRLGEIVRHTTSEMIQRRKERLAKAVACYRFMDIDRFLDDIDSQGLWISDPKTFNDPFDLGIKVENLTERGPFGDEDALRRAFGEIFSRNTRVNDFWYYDESLIQALNSWIKGQAHHMSVINQFKRRIRCFGVTCFAPDWEVPLMWSHYARSHTGVCVEWTINPISFAAAKENLHLAQYPVRYMTRLPTICLSELLFTPYQVLSNFVASKHADWAYEKEWRLVNYEEKATRISMPKYMEMSAIIVGLNFDMSAMERLTAKAALMNLPVYRIVSRYDYDLKLDAY